MSDQFIAIGFIVILCAVFMVLGCWDEWRAR